MQNEEVKVRPQLDDESVVKLVKKLYDFSVTSVKELNAYNDKNCWIKIKDHHDNPHVDKIFNDGYILKIMNTIDSKYPDVIDGQNKMMIFLHENLIPCSVPVKNTDGDLFSLVHIKENDTQKYIVRLLTFIPGETLFNVPISPRHLQEVGSLTAKLNNILRGFDHPSFKERKFDWMLIAAPKIKEFINVIKNDEDKHLIIEIINCFENKVMKNIDSFEKGIIHGDINEQNLLVDAKTKLNIIGVIDFGDSHYSCVIFDLIIAICYMIIQTNNVNSGKYVVQGFEMIKKLKSIEKSILKIGVCMRICQSLVYSAYYHSIDPENDYILTTQINGWNVLRELWKLSDEQIFKIWNL